MSKLDWERRGPPRPGSGAVDHPQGIQRPYVHVTEEEKKRRRQERASEERERVEAIRKAQRIASFGYDPLDPLDDGGLSNT